MKCSSDDVCSYSTCAFLDCHVDADVDNTQHRELVNLLRSIAPYTNYH